MGASSDIAFFSRALKAPRIAALASSLAEQARSEGSDHETYLAQVLSEEVASRESRGGTPGCGRRASRRSRRWTTSTSPSSARPPPDDLPPGAA
jgi:hypothetical protein